MRNTTEGLNAALMGVAWRPGDEVVTTQLEHVCLFSVLGMVAHRHGVIVRTVDIGDGGGDVTGALRSALTSRTRVIAISHVQWSSGAVMPLAEIAQLAGERGILTVIDAAQGPGHVPVDLATLGVDAYALAGQKWLCGPSASGALFVRPDRIGDFRPTYLRSGAFDSHGFVVPPVGAQRYETGEHALPTLRAQLAALRWLRDDAGCNWLLARNALLGRRLADGLERIGGVRVTTPLHRMAGIVCFTVDGTSVHEVVDRAFSSGYTIRAVDQRPGPTVVRASTGWWCTEDEIDGLIEVVAEIAGTVSR
jgi:L-cysteine/cystine lyase